MNTFKNNLSAALYYDMSATDTVIWLKQLVTSSDAAARLAAWPTCDATHTFNLTLESTVDNKVREIVECTAVTANTDDYITFSCARAREGTVAIAHGKDTTTVENRVTAAALATITDAITGLATAVSANTANINDVTTSVTALATTMIGSIQSVLATSSYVPNGCVPADGAEYTKAQFTTLYNDYLTSGKLLTCTYTAWATQVGLTGNCAKFALDTVNQKFKVPLLKDGDSITQAASAAELGKSVKAGLPNITATVGSIWHTELATGACYRDNNVSGITAGAGSVNYGTVYFDASRSSSVYGNSTTVTDEQVRLRHFVVVAPAQNNANVFDWSNYMAGLAGKLNVDFSNAPANRPYITEYWEATNRATWYRKWSNGLIEQGISGNGAASVTFPTPFLRSDKTRFYKVGLLGSSTAAYSPTFVVHSDSLTGADVSTRINGNSNSDLWWTLEVSGY